MLFKYYFLILIDVSILVKKSKSDFLKNCSYEYTVDLTKSIQFQNNYYIYDKDTLITPDLVANYTYRISNNGTRIDNVKPHKRGCICAIKNCIRFCSNRAIESYKNGLLFDVDKVFTKNVTLSNKQSVEKHLIHDFYPIFGSVCKSPELVPENNWTLYEDGILRHNLVEKNLTQKEYCFDIKVFENNTLQVINPVVCNKTSKAKARPWIQIYGFVFSIPFFISTIILFVLFTNLSNVRGKCFVTYLSLLAISYTLFSIHKISGFPKGDASCHIYGSITYFFTISFYTWCCILCYDAWTTLTHMVIEKPSYKKYAKIGFTIPLIMASIKCVADCLAELPKPLNCIFLNTNRLPLLWFFDLPGIIMAIYCSTLYILILRYSWKTRRDQISYFTEGQKEQIEKIMTYSRILVLMGFEWIFVFIARSLRLLYPNNEKLVLICIHVFYAATILQGPLMLIIFIFSPNIRNGIKKKFTKNPSAVNLKLSRNRHRRA